MKPFVAEVTTIEPAAYPMFSANEQGMADAVARGLPDFIQWMPQAIKFKIPLNDDDSFIYRPNFVFRRLDSGKTLVTVIMEPKSLPLPNIYKMKLLEDACGSVDMEAILVLNLADGDDKRLREILFSCEVKYATIARASDIVDVIVRQLKGSVSEQTASLPLKKKR